ncbi:MAG TPA: hypothetical protein VIL74_09060 [Pyrinomonadaceae bacterium]|jgi:hypothetical protein
MSTYSEIIARVETLVAGRAADPNTSPLVDGAALTAEAVFPLALRFAARRLLAAGDNRLNLAQNHTIILTFGSGNLPSSVLAEYLRSRSFLPGDSLASWLDYPDYQRARHDSMLNYFSAHNGTFYYSGTGNSVVLNAVSLPAIPSNPDSAVTWSEKLTEQAIATACACLTGELSFAALSGDA